MGGGRSRTEEMLLLLIGQHSMDGRLHYVVGRDVVVRGYRQSSGLHVDPTIEREVEGKCTSKLVSVCTTTGGGGGRKAIKRQLSHSSSSS